MTIYNYFLVHNEIITQLPSANPPRFDLSELKILSCSLQKPGIREAVQLNPFQMGLNDAYTFTYIYIDSHDLKRCD